MVAGNPEQPRALGCYRNLTEPGKGSTKGGRDDVFDVIALHPRSHIAAELCDVRAEQIAERLVGSRYLFDQIRRLPKKQASRGLSVRK
jgi:hypothetical protein